MHQHQIESAERKLFLHKACRGRARLLKLTHIYTNISGSCDYSVCDPELRILNQNLLPPQSVALWNSGVPKLQLLYLDVLVM